MPDVNTVTIYGGALAGTVIGEATYNAAAQTWTYSASGLSGFNMLKAVSEDLAGNIAASSVIKAYFGATQIPSADLIDDSGASDTDNITNDNSPRINFALDLSSCVTAMGVNMSASSITTVYLERKPNSDADWADAVEMSTDAPTITVATGAVSHDFTQATLADDDYDVRLRWKDALGTYSSYSDILTFRVDTSVPAPTITTPGWGDGVIYIGSTINMAGTAT